jgi:hypothetical protein
VLVGLASAGAACGLAGDVTVFVGSCTHFVTTVRTNEPSYAPGQTVIISVTQANDGPACTIPPQPCGPPSASVSAYNSAGQDVWDYGAHKTMLGHITCYAGSLPRMTWTASYSDTQVLGWGQDKCRYGAEQWGYANPNCPGTAAPAGTYRIVAIFYWSDGRILGHSSPTTATITISG